MDKKFEMYIMAPSCFTTSSKKVKDQSKEDANSIDNLIFDNPLLFRICCWCFVRRRKRVGTAKQNGTFNIADDVSSILNIDHIEFTNGKTT